MAIPPSRHTSIHIQHLAGGIEAKRKFIKPLTSQRTCYTDDECSKQASQHQHFIPHSFHVVHHWYNFDHHPQPHHHHSLTINKSRPPHNLALCKYCWQERIFRKLIFHNSTIDSIWIRSVLIFWRNRTMQMTTRNVGWYDYSHINHIPTTCIVLHLHLCTREDIVN